MVCSILDTAHHAAACPPRPVACSQHTLKEGALWCACDPQALCAGGSRGGHRAGGAVPQQVGARGLQVGWGFNRHAGTRVLTANGCAGVGGFTRMIAMRAAVVFHPARLLAEKLLCACCACPACACSVPLLSSLSREQKMQLIDAFTEEVYEGGWCWGMHKCVHGHVCWAKEEHMGEWQGFRRRAC